VQGRRGSTNATPRERETWKFGFYCKLRGIGGIIRAPKTKPKEGKIHGKNYGVEVKRLTRLNLSTLTLRVKKTHSTKEKKGEGKASGLN